MTVKNARLLILSAALLLGGFAVAQTAEEYTKSGDVKMKAKNYTDAVTDYTVAIQMNQARTAEYFKKINYYNALTDDKKLLVDTSVTFEGKNAICGPYYKRGLALCELGKRNEAAPDFETAIKIEPKLGTAHYHLAMLEKEKGNKEITCMKMSIAIGYGSKEAQDEFDNMFCWNISMEAFKEGQTQLNLRNYENAIKSFDRALMVSPDSITYMKRGIAYMGLGQNDKALADLNMAYKTGKSNTEIVYNRGLVHMKLMKFQEAFDDFSKAIAAQPGFYNAYMQRAEAAEELDLKKAAVYDYNNMIKLKPDDGMPYYKRAIIKETDLADKTGACADFRKAFELGIEEAESRLCKEKKSYKEKMDALDK